MANILTREQFEEQYKAAVDSGLQKSDAIVALSKGQRFNSAAQPASQPQSVPQMQPSTPSRLLSREEFDAQFAAATKSGLNKQEAIKALSSGKRFAAQDSALTQGGVSTQAPSADGVNPLYGSNPTLIEAREKEKTDSRSVLEKTRALFADNPLSEAVTQRRLGRLQEKYGDKVFDDNFIGQFRANYGAGKLNIELDQAYSDYLDNPTEENATYIKSLENLISSMTANNAEALDDKNVQAKWISKDIAQYLPQLGGQIKKSLPMLIPAAIGGAKAGAAGGAAVGSVIPGAGTATGGFAGGVAGAISASRLPFVAGSFLFSYDTMRGAAYRELVMSGVGETQAKDAAADEAIVSSLIETGDTAFDVLTGIPGIKNVVKNLSEKATKTAVRKLATEVTKYAANIGQEYSEEFLQEIITQANVRRCERGEYDSGVMGLIKEATDICGEYAKEVQKSGVGNALAGKTSNEGLNEAAAAGQGGAIIGGVMGGTRSVVGSQMNRLYTAQVSKMLDTVKTENLANADLQTLNRLFYIAKNSGNKEAASIVEKELERRSTVDTGRQNSAPADVDIPEGRGFRDRMKNEQKASATPAAPVASELSEDELKQYFNLPVDRPISSLGLSTETLGRMYQRAMTDGDIKLASDIETAIKQQQQQASSQQSQQPVQQQQQQPSPPAQEQQPIQQPTPAKKQSSDIHTLVKDSGAKTVGEIMEVLRNASSDQAVFEQIMESGKNKLADGRTKLGKALRLLRNEFKTGTGPKVDTYRWENPEITRIIDEDKNSTLHAANAIEEKAVQQETDVEQVTPAQNAEETVKADSPVTSPEDSAIIEEQVDNQEAETAGISSTAPGNEYLRNDFNSPIAIHGIDRSYSSVDEAMADPRIRNNRTLEDVVRAKFQQNRDIRQKLFATGDAKIDDGTELGAILERVRDELRAPDSVFNDISPYDNADNMSFNQFAALVSQQNEQKKGRENKLLSRMRKENSNEHDSLPDQEREGRGSLGDNGQRSPGLSSETSESNRENSGRPQKLPKWASDERSRGYGTEVSGRYGTGDTIFDAERKGLGGPGTWVYGYGSYDIKKAAIGTPAHFVQSVLAKAFNVLNKTVLVSGEIYVAYSPGVTVRGGSNGRQIVSCFQNRGTYRQKTYGIRNFVHEVMHHVFNDKYGGYDENGKISDFDTYFRRKRMVYSYAADAFGSFGIREGLSLKSLDDICDYYLYDIGYALSYDDNGVAENAVGNKRDALRAAVSEEVVNDILGGNDNIMDAVKAGYLTEENVNSLRDYLLETFEATDIITPEQSAAIREAHSVIADHDFIGVDKDVQSLSDALANSLNISEDMQDQVSDLVQKLLSGNSTQAEAEVSSGPYKNLPRILNTLLGRTRFDVSELSVDELNYAINYTLKHSDVIGESKYKREFSIKENEPSTPSERYTVKENRRNYNSIANFLSGENLDKQGLRRGLDPNLIAPEIGKADSIMVHRADNNKLYQTISAGRLQDTDDGYIDKETPRKIGKYNPPTRVSEKEQLTNLERKVLTAAINELERRKRNLWGDPISEEKSLSREEYEKQEKGWWKEKEYDKTDQHTEHAGDYSDEIEEDLERYEKKQHEKDLKKMKEGDNWVEGLVPVSPEPKVMLDGKKYQGWVEIYDVSLHTREHAKQRVLKHRAAQALKATVENLFKQYEDSLDAVDRMVRNAPSVRPISNEIYSILDSVNEDIENLRSVEELFENASDSDQRELAEYGSHLLSSIESKRDHISELGKELIAARDKFREEHREEIKEADKRTKKDLARYQAKKAIMDEYEQRSVGGDTGGAMSDAMRTNPFDNAPTEVIRRILNDGEATFNVLADYVGEEEAAHLMSGFYDRDINGKRVYKRAHTLTTYDKSALHRILSERRSGKKSPGIFGAGFDANKYEVLPPEAESGVTVEDYDVSDRAQYYVGDDGVKHPVVRPSGAEISPGDRALMESHIRGGDYSPSAYNPKLRQFSQGEEARRIAPGNKETSTVSAEETDEIAARNLSAYQEQMREGSGETIEPSWEASPENLARLDKLFAERLGIWNSGNTAVAFANQDNRSVEQMKAEQREARKRKRERKRGTVAEAELSGNRSSRDVNADFNTVEAAASSILSRKSIFDGKTHGTANQAEQMKSVREAVDGIAYGDKPVESMQNLVNLYRDYRQDGNEMKRFTTDEINSAIDDLQSIIDNKDISDNKKAFQLESASIRLLSLISARNRNVEHVTQDLAKFRDSIQKYANRKSANKVYNMLTKTKLGEKTQDVWKALESYQLNPMTMFKMLDGFDKNAKGIGYSYAKRIQDGTAKYQRTYFEAVSKLQELASEKGFSDFAEDKNKCSVKLGDHELTEQEAVDFIKQVRSLTATWTRNGRRIDNIKGFALKQKDGSYTWITQKDIGNAKWSDLADKMEAGLSDIAKKYIGVSSGVFSELGQKVSTTKRNITGIGFWTMDSGDYYPAYYASPSDEKVWVDDGISEKLGDSDYVVIQPASQTVDQYVHRASNYVAYGGLAELLGIMNQQSVDQRSLPNLVGDAYGKHFARMFNNYSEHVNQMWHTESVGDPINDTLRKGRLKLQTGALSMSVSVPIKQVASYWSAAGILSPESLVKAWRFKLLKEKGAGADEAVLGYRKVGGIDPTISEILNNKGLLENIKKKNRILDAFSKATSTMDYRTVDNLYTATVLDVKNSYPDVDVNSAAFASLVSSKFEEVVLNTQPIFTSNARAEYQRTNNEIIRGLSMFRTQQTQNFNRVITALGEYRAAQMNGSATQLSAMIDLQNTLKGQMLAAVEFGALSIVADVLLHKQKKYEDDDTEELAPEKVLERLAMNTAESAAGTVWFADQATKYLIDRVSKLGNKETHEFYGISFGALSTIKSAMDSIDTCIENPTASNFRYAAGYIAQVFGVPLNNVYSELNSIIMYAADIGGLNKGNYNDILQAAQAMSKPDYDEKMIKREANKAIRTNDHKNLLYAVSKLNDLGDEDDRKGREYLGDTLKKRGFNPELEVSPRIANYLVNAGYTDKQIDETIEAYAFTGSDYYNRFYAGLRDAGLTPKEAVAKYEEIDSLDKDNGSITQDELKMYYKLHPEDENLIIAIWNARGWKSKWKRPK